MAKLKNNQITSAEILSYLKQTDDFALEMRTLKETSAIGLSCTHGWTYHDPVTGKPRQYDIRADYVSGCVFIKFAVECKALTPAYPLVISRVPRPNHDSFNMAVLTRYSNWDGAECIVQAKDASLYLPGKPVGKSCNQLGIKEDGSFISDDGKVYDKWAQAIASSRDLMHEFLLNKNQEYRACAVFPVLVVPDDTLWCVDYDSDGSLLAGSPSKVPDCEFFIGHDYFFPLMSRSLCYTMSHLYLVTSSSYRTFLNKMISIISPQLKEMIATKQNSKKPT